MEHTKEKWVIMPYTRRDGDNIRWVKDEKNKSICQTFKPRAEANARLIAAAPDLLAACEDALEAMNTPAVQAEGEWQQGLFCGLEDRDLTDRYEACMYGYEQALSKIEEWVLCGFQQAIAKTKGETK